MKNKIGFNLIFALLAFPIGLALYREFDFQQGRFEKPALGFLYLVTFAIALYLMLKKNERSA
jgi:hypothetical protein